MVDRANLEQALSKCIISANSTAIATMAATIITRTSKLTINTQMEPRMVKFQPVLRHESRRVARRQNEWPNLFHENIRRRRCFRITRIYGEIWILHHTLYRFCCILKFAAWEELLCSAYANRKDWVLRHCTTMQYTALSEFGASCVLLSFGLGILRGNF